MDGRNKCFHCGHETVIWDNDFDFSEMGYEGNGIVHICHCGKCGAEIEYRVEMNEEPPKTSGYEGGACSIF